MKLSLEKKKEIITVLVSKSFPTEKERELEGSISDELEKLDVFKIPIMLFKEYSAYILSKNTCYINDEIINLNFSYATRGYYTNVYLNTKDLSLDIIAAFNKLCAWRKAKADFKKDLTNTVIACNTSKQFTDLVPSAKSLFEEKNASTQLVPKDLIDRVNGILGGCK